MEIDPQVKSRVWWRGALSSAAKGIPHGLLLGALGFALLTGAICAIAAFPPASAFMVEWLAGPFGTFLFSHAAVTTLATGAMPAMALASFNPLPVIALNTILTAVGNFLTGGDMAVAQYQQQVDHARNDQRISAIEGREQQIEQAIGSRSQAMQQILAQGPRSSQGFAEAETTRAANAPTSPTRH